MYHLETENNSNSKYQWLLARWLFALDMGQISKHQEFALLFLAKFSDIPIQDMPTLTHGFLSHDLLPQHSGRGISISEVAQRNYKNKCFFIICRCCTQGFIKTSSQCHSKQKTYSHSDIMAAIHSSCLCLKMVSLYQQKSSSLHRKALNWSADQQIAR